MNKVLIIAEAGVNHNGDILMAKKLIDAAAAANVDIVKFQTFKASNLVSKEAVKADYQSENLPDNDNSQYSMLKKLELSEADHHELIEYCNGKDVRFLSTGFDEQSIEFLAELGIKLFKIPSGEITNLPYLKMVASKANEIVISTGMSDMTDIENALSVLTGKGIASEKITVLHCNTEYPTPFKDVNLHAMTSIANKFGVEIGYSDHTLGIEVPIAAVALGAKVIEKHFTLDRTLPGPDHRASLEPHELKAMVDSIRNIELAISGDGIKRPSESEQKNIALGRKSLHASREIQQGDEIKDDDLIALRPGDGISPMEIENVIGKKANKRIERYQKLNFKDLT